MLDVSVDCTTREVVVGEQADPDTVPRFSVTCACMGAFARSLRLATVTATVVVALVVNVNAVDVPDGTSVPEKNFDSLMKLFVGVGVVGVSEQPETRPTNATDSHRNCLLISPLTSSR
jgi:hypothetical protein